MTQNHYLAKSTSVALSKIFNVEISEIENNKQLFYKIDPYIAKCVEYLSEIEDENLKTSAVMSLNYLIKYEESIFDDNKK
jgi:hypothetical protein